MIEVSRLSKCFGSLQVLNSLSFRVAQGEFVTIFGPSGCGKTTLLRILATLEQPDRGTIEVNGVDGFARHEEYKGKISLVWQDPRLLPWRTALQNVTFALEMRYPEVSKEEAGRRAREAIKFVGLLDFADHLPRQLSGGMRQRINLARALVLDADIMLMDEPLASLNEITEKRQLMNEIAHLWEVKRKTVVYVTHSVSEAVYLSDRILVFSDKPTALLEEVRVPLSRPRNLTSRTAEEIGNHISELFGGMIA
ncbi:MAG: ABC transporter ATP-binding protein [Candidatus Tectomicrobia bacterium]|uniref:ABC transporter ATP-binding protein n=1 Tax=Tectimicrobiota bacterium TaxID=2528274 RepID=A0A932GPA0_UNCTE|nr:ABC transporter ATP-binding protein [Candidatus Tectomicrobia bacterium]